MKFIKLYQSVWDNGDIQNLSDYTFRFLIFILLISYSQRDKNQFIITPKEVYSKFKMSRSKLWRIQKELKTLNIDVEYTHKEYKFNLTDFFQIYYPNNNSESEVGKW